MSDVGSVQEWVSEAQRQERGDDTNIVRFFMREKSDPKESQIAGRPKFKMVPYVEIFAPGQIRNTRIERPARDEDKLKYPRAWEQFERTKADTVDGTPLEAWPYLNRAQVAEYRAIGFLTVESIVNASDSGLEKIGHGARDMQKRAAQWLKPQSDVETELRAQVQRQADRMNEMQMKLDHMTSALEARSKRGRPRKADHDASDDSPDGA